MIKLRDIPQSYSKEEELPVRIDQAGRVQNGSSRLGTLITF